MEQPAGLFRRCSGLFRRCSGLFRRCSGLFRRCSGLFRCSGLVFRVLVHALFVGRLNSKNFQHLTQINNALTYARQNFQQSMANLNNESYHSLIGSLTPEYLGFLKLQVVPRFTGTRTCISPVPVNQKRGILTSLSWYGTIHPFDNYVTTTLFST
jgi:hypothetical protein